MIIIFQPTYSSLGSLVARAYPSSSGCKQHPLWTRHPSTHPHSCTLGQCRHTNSPHVHIFGMWEETRVPGENPHRQWPWQGTGNVFFINIVIKSTWCYSRTCYISSPTTSSCRWYKWRQSGNLSWAPQSVNGISSAPSVRLLDRPGQRECRINHS